eukprot:Selendium_serpulae@DN5708_c1_g1_i1.p1
MDVGSSGAAAVASGPSRYTLLDAHIGQGAYGKVEKAQDTLDGEIVAIKKVKVERPEPELSKSIAEHGVNHTVLREIKVCRELNHENIMTIKDVFVEGDFINLVMPHMAYDLKALMSNTPLLNSAQQKCLLHQILRGLDALHSSWYLHRDLAPANVFISSNGVCKVGDFGLARQFAAPNCGALTPKVVTLWYRAPELLFGAAHYHDRVDMWSVGCIFAEILANGRTQKVIFPGSDEIDQLGRIFKVLGTPDAKNGDPWPNVKELPLFLEFSHCRPMDLNAMFPGVTADALDLLKKLLVLDPLQRLTAPQALSHPYFTTPPLACPPSDLPNPSSP